MRTLRFAGWIELTGLPMAPAPYRYTDYSDRVDVANLSRSAEELSVMTYNVKGLPWPATWGREPALAAIGKKFAQMRERKAQPHAISR